MDGYRGSLRCKFHSRVKNLKRTIPKLLTTHHPVDLEAFMQYSCCILWLICLAFFIPNRLKTTMKQRDAKSNTHTHSTHDKADLKMSNNLDLLSGNDHPFVCISKCYQSYMDWGFKCTVWDKEWAHKDVSYLKKQHHGRPASQKCNASKPSL